MRELMTDQGNLFRVAADQLGDPLLWTRIARASRLLDPFLSGMALVKIPDRNDPAS